MKIDFKKINILKIIAVMAGIVILVATFYITGDAYKRIISFSGLFVSVASFLVASKGSQIKELFNKLNIDLDLYLIKFIETNMKSLSIAIMVKDICKAAYKKKFKDYNDNQKLSKKSITVTEMIVSEEGNKTRAITILLFMILNIEYIFFSKYPSINLISGVQFLLFILLFSRYLLMRFRVNHGYFGFNKHEAMIIVRFIKKNEDKFNGGGGGKVRVFKGRLAKEYVGETELYGEVVPK